MTSDKYKVVATKVRPEVKRRIAKICAARGINEYQMLQMMCDCIVRYMDDQHNLTPEMEQAMAIFEHLDGWQNAFNLADPTLTPTISEATYYLADHPRRKQGVRAVHVSHPFMGDWQQTENLQQILERTINLLCPERYKRLRRLAVDMDCRSLLELFDRLIDHHSNDLDTAEYRKTFEDADRHEYGKVIAFGQRTRRHPHKDINNFEQRQQTIHFDPADLPDLPELKQTDDEQTID